MEIVLLKLPLHAQKSFLVKLGGKLKVLVLPE